MRESSLHLALKQYYANQGAELEVNVYDRLIDARLGDSLIEIQTQNFYHLKPKLELLLEEYQIKIIYPIALEKRIIYLPEDKNQTLLTRKSPKHGRFVHLFEEFVYISNYAIHRHFSLEALLIIEEEIRQNDGVGSWRRNGWSILDRKLVEIKGKLLLSKPDDYRQFVPQSLSRPFTTSELANSLGISYRAASKMTYSLKTMNVIEKAGKKGRSFLYSDQK